MSFRILIGIYCHNIPTHTPQEWVPRGHRGRQNRQHSKNGRKVDKPQKRSSHSAPYKPMESGPGNTFLAQKFWKAANGGGRDGWVTGGGGSPSGGGGLFPVKKFDVDKGGGGGLM